MTSVAILAVSSVLFMGPPSAMPGSALAADKPGSKPYVEIKRVAYADGFEPSEMSELGKFELDESLQPDIVADEVLPGGQRRVYETIRVPVSESRLASLRAAGKSFELDPQSRQLLVDTFRDYLPTDWHMGAPDGALMDSYGNSIVNRAAGLPDWAARDVAALRDSIREWRDRRTQSLALGADTRETDGVLGNFIGQALVRNIDVSDLVSLTDSSIIGSGVAHSIVGYLHFFENLKYVHATDGGYTYSPSTYPASVVELVNASGASMGDVLAIESEPEIGDRGNTSSGCYDRVAFARGMTNLSGQTNIWLGGDVDDEQADVPTGFPVFFFYSCQNSNNNDTVRVSTNGYISFFQQGGGALDGTEFNNAAIPDASDPDGFAAPWWDDLIVAANQGTTDRVSYKTEGSVRARVFTVEWFSVSRLNGDAGDWHFFQLKLYETTGVVEIHISNDWNSDALDRSTTGIETYDGVLGDCGPNCTSLNNAPPPNNYRFTPQPRPSNDNCTNATELLNGASVDANLRLATPDGNASCGNSSNNRDVWYTFVARCNGTLFVDTCGSRDLGGVDAGADTVLSVHSGCPGTIANQLACNDDTDASGCTSVDSAVSVPMVIGQRVYVRVTHFGEDAFRVGNGRFQLNLNLVSNAAPANDACANAFQIVAGNTLVGNMLCASNDGESDCGSSATNPDIWYQFSAGAQPGTLRLSLCGSRNNGGTDTGPDTVISVHSGCPGTVANQLACNDDGFTAGCAALDSAVLVALAPGQNVKIRVSHFGDNEFRVGNGIIALHADFGCATPCTGDINFDGRVDLGDLAELLIHFGSTFPAPTYSAGSDLNCNRSNDLADLAELLIRFGTNCP